MIIVAPMASVSRTAKIFSPSVFLPNNPSSSLSFLSRDARPSFKALAVVATSENPRPAKPARILVAEEIGESGVAVLRAFGEVELAQGKLSELDLISRAAESDALVVRSGTRVGRAVFEAARGRLRVVGRAGVGIDNVDLAAATEFGCLVVNAPNANTVAAAEHAIALLTAMARNVAQADASVKAGKWERSKYVGVSLVGKTLGIIGFGKVGTEVGRRAKGLGMLVIAHDPFASADRARTIGVDLVSFEQAIFASDFISLHTPLTLTTSKLFDDETFSKMKKGVRIINVARGGVIDDDALLRALESDIVAQVALDVFTEEPPPKDSKLVQHQNVIVTPHLGASTKEAQEGVAIEIAEAVVGALKGELSATAINAPMVSPQVLLEMGPYMELAEKLGKLGAQLAGKIESAKVIYNTSRGPGDLDTRLLRAMITKGLVSSSSSMVNLVNADFTANQRGLKITEERVEARDSSPEFPVDSIELRIVSSGTGRNNKFASSVSGEVSVEGKVERGSARLKRVGGFSVDASLESGNLLLCRQVDQPGMIGQVGNILARHNVNVSFMSVARNARRKKAIMAIGVDEQPDQDTQNEIGQVPAIEEFVFLET